MSERWGRELDPVTKKRIQAELKMGNDIWNKMVAMGMQSPPAVIMAHLPETYTMRGQLGELIEQFLSADVKDRKANGGVLVGVRVRILQHADPEIGDILKALEEVIAFCGATPRTSSTPARRLGRRRAQKKAKLAQDITNKLLALGRRRPSTVLGERLSDLYVAFEDNERVVDRFLRTDVKDLKAMGKVLVDIKAALDVIRYHIKKVRRPLDGAIHYCYEEDADTQASEEP